jgi:hypothetical protein
MHMRFTAPGKEDRDFSTLSCNVPVVESCLVACFDQKSIADRGTIYCLAEESFKILGRYRIVQLFRGLQVKQ